MRRLMLEATPGAAAPARIVLVAGAYQEPEDFVREGFADAVQARGLAIDLELIAPDLGHLLDRAILDSLRREVILPAHSAGCRQLWLGGISLGGFIALSYAQRWPAELDGICLLAPYLGNRMITSEIASAGGAKVWQAEQIAEDDEERRLWAFIQQLADSTLQVHLGAGRQDRFSQGHALLAQVLNASAVQMIDGGHDWSVWRELWRLFLDRQW